MIQKHAVGTVKLFSFQYRQDCEFLQSCQSSFHIPNLATKSDTDITKTSSRSSLV